ncbi:hypothetical protein [Acidimangrovimonas sediminis]|uniref:hypothetical protein n=1 Tax=Acidimangrovimonas sediminis TaxID=2056283 RepID=UPI000C803DF2|nr:hypothetical protein [Acidimangrovimonas sediminis]
MDRIVASFHVDAAAWAEFRALCSAASETPDTALRNLLRLEIRRRTRRRTRRSEAPDEALLDRLRRLVAEALENSTDWQGYRCALRDRGLDIAPKGGGLVVRSAADGRELAKASLVGPGYLPLVRRFGAPMPGHPQTRLAAIAMGEPPRAHGCTDIDGGPEDDPDDDFDLIEPC